MKLYFSPGACSLAPHIVCEELGLHYQALQVDLRTKKLKDGGEDFLKINPKGYVPFIATDDGLELSEVAVILQYLASLKPDANLFPQQGAMLWHGREWLNFLASEVHKSFGPVFHGNQMVTNPDSQKELKTYVEKKLGDRFDYIAHVLKKDNFLMGTFFTVVDAYLFTLLRWTAKLSIQLPAEIQTYRQRITDRPAVQRVLKAEGLLSSHT